MRISSAEAEDRDEDAHVTARPLSARRRASASASTRSSRSRAGAPSTSASASATVSEIAEERQPAVEERLDRDLVRRVEGARVVPPSSPARAREREQRERLEVRRDELEREPAARSSARHVAWRGAPDSRARTRSEPSCRDSRDGRAPRRPGSAREHARSRSDGQRSRSLVRKSEEEVRLDQLEPLVRERRRVDGDLRPHAPRRMGERLVDADVLELVPRAAAERAAGGREDDRVDGVARAALEALEDGAVLASRRAAAGRLPAPARAARARRRRRGSPCSRARA